MYGLIHIDTLIHWQKTVMATHVWIFLHSKLNYVKFSLLYWKIHLWLHILLTLSEAYP